MSALNQPGQLRRFDPTRDGDAVINLVEEAFNLKNDPEGQAMLRQMRSEGGRPRSSPTLHLVSGGNEGFVWEVDGRIVGNISLLPFQSGLKSIILIANVAVEAAYQGRGIATELTRHALRIARQRPFGEIWLQVRSDNQRAIHIYQALGFRFFSSLTQWRKAARGYDTAFGARRYEGVLFRRRLADWQQQETWLNQAYPKQTRWYANFDFNLLHPLAWVNPFNWVDLMSASTHCLRGNNQLMAAITHQQTSRRGDRVWLAVDKPTTTDGRIATLLGAFFESYWDGMELSLEYPVGWGAETIAKAGFVAKRDLDWMRFEAK